MDFELNLLKYDVKELLDSQGKKFDKPGLLRHIEFRLGGSSGTYRLLQSNMVDGMLYMKFTATYLQDDTCKRSLRAVMGKRIHGCLSRPEMQWFNGGVDNAFDCIPHDFVCMHGKVEPIPSSQHTAGYYLNTCENFVYFTFASPSLLSLKIEKAKVETVEI